MGITSLRRNGLAHAGPYSSEPAPTRVPPPPRPMSRRTLPGGRTESSFPADWGASGTHAQLGDKLQSAGMYTLEVIGSTGLDCLRAQVMVSDDELREIERVLTWNRIEMAWSAPKENEQ